MGRKGFSFHPTREALVAYAKLSAKQKLEWLEEINRFLYNAMPKSRRRIAEKFRSGEI